MLKRHPFTALMIFAATHLLASGTDSTPRNMTGDIIAKMQWQNSPLDHEGVSGSLVVRFVEGTDFFNNPEDVRRYERS